MKLRGILIAAVLVCGCNTCLNPASIPFDGTESDNNATPDAGDMGGSDVDIVVDDQGVADVGGDDGTVDIGVPDGDMACVDNTDPCALNGRECGELEFEDACGAEREVNCGTCGENGQCVDDGRCLCDDGFEPTEEGCADVDECDRELDNCDEQEMCVNTAGGFLRFDCPAGQVRNEEQTCVDFDECDAGAHNCDPRVECTNLEPFFECGDCPPGFDDVNSDGTLCEDIDECATNMDNCDVNAACTNVSGSFECMCNSGYIGDGVTCTPSSSNALVRSVSSVWLDMNGDSAREPLPAGMDPAKVVPFASATIENVEDDVEASLVDVWIDTSSGEVVAEREKDDEVAFVTVYLVEFDSAVVQSGTWSMSGTSSTETLSQAVDPDHAFLTFSTMYNGIGDRDDAFTGGVLTGSTVEFRRFAMSGSASGHYYVVSAPNDELTVQHSVVTIAPTESCESASITSDLDQSFVIASASTYSPGGPFVASGDDPAEVHGQCELSSSTELECCRGVASEPTFGVGLRVAVQVISFDAALNGAVQRGRLDLPDVSSAVASLTPAVDPAVSTPLFSIGVLGASIAADELSSNDESAAFATLEFANLGAEVLAERLETAPETTTLWWKVVTWPH